MKNPPCMALAVAFVGPSDNRLSDAKNISSVMG
jgi:hypothetical protein